MPLWYLDICLQNVHLTLKAAEGIRLSKPLTTFKVAEKDAGKVYEVTIPDIYWYAVVLCVQ